MIVVDASVVIEFLMPQGIRHAGAVARLGPELRWSSPHLVDIEVANYLRRQLLAGRITDKQFEGFVDVYRGFPIERIGHLSLLQRMRQLAHNFTAYDAAYVALAERLACPLVTCDGKATNAPNHNATVEVIT